MFSYWDAGTTSGEPDASGSSCSSDDSAMGEGAAMLAALAPSGKTGALNGWLRAINCSSCTWESLGGIVDNLTCTRCPGPVFHDCVDPPKFESASTAVSLVNFAATTQRTRIKQIPKTNRLDFRIVNMVALLPAHYQSARVFKLF